MSRMIKIPLILCIITLLTSGLLMISEALTHEKIAEQKKILLLASLKQLIPDASHDNDLTQSTLTLNEPDKLGHRNEKQAYIGFLREELSIVAIPITSQTGYSGDIDLIVGIKANGEITAVKILEQHETPGLGDLIEAHKSDWLMQFPGKSLSKLSEKQWQVKRDGGEFDQITGATITPRAVVKAVHQALKYFKENKQLFDNINSKPLTSGDTNE